MRLTVCLLFALMVLFSSCKGEQQEKPGLIDGKILAFEDVKHYIDSCRTLIPLCADSKDAGCNCNTSLVILESPVRKSGIISIRSRDLLEPEKKLENVEMSLESPDFGECDGQTVKIEQEILLFENDNCAKLFEKHGIK